jgi:murein tripeptide amidase MpaA
MKGRAMRVRSDIDGGNIVVIEQLEDELVLCIRNDTNAVYRQWFHFCVDDAEPCLVRITGLGSTTYPDAWEGYEVCATYDGEEWFRAPTVVEDDALCFEIEEAVDSIQFAYFTPFSSERHAALIEHARGLARVESIGHSVQGRPIDVVTAGDGELVLWVIARQHPGETMAEWCAEGLLGKLLSDDPLAVALRERATIHVVSNMNPDGSALGNLRANAAGINLNRMWLEPTEESPEVRAVRARMEETSVDLFLDIHGDERNPFCFLAGCEGNPGYDERLRALENVFEQALLEQNEDFQDEYGYERDEPGGGDLRTAGNWVGEHFDCLSFTLEMPFKQPWDTDRARRLGASVVEAMLATLDELR